MASADSLKLAFRFCLKSDQACRSSAAAAAEASPDAAVVDFLLFVGGGGCGAGLFSC